MIEFKGLNGRLVLYDNYVSVMRETMIAKTFHNTKEIHIPYNQIQTIKLVPGSLINGFICIVLRGSVAPTDIFSALKDTNTIIFRLTKNTLAYQFKTLVESKIT